MAKYKWDNLILFVEQLSSALALKLPMDKTIHNMSREAIDKGWKKAQANVSELVQLGSSLSDALDNYPKYFPRMLRKMVRAGEEGGALSRMLVSVSGYLQSAREVQHKLQKCLIYPFLIWTILLLEMILFGYMVIPKFINMYGSQLPEMTQLYMGIGPAILIVGDGLLFYFAWILIGWVGTDVEGRSASARFVDRILLYVPFIPFLGLLQRHAKSAEVCEMIGVLMEAGNSGQEAIQLAKESVSSPMLRIAMEELDTAITAGESYSGGDHNLIIPHTTLWMIAESAGSGNTETLGKTLQNMASYHRRQLDSLTTIVREILEPFLIFAVVVLGGFTMVALYLPLFNYFNIFSAVRF